MLEKHLTISTTLRQLTCKESLILLGIHITDQAFLRLEVKGHCVTLILITSHLEDRRACQLLSGGIHLTRGMHEVTIQTHVYLFTGQVHILVFHRRIAIKMGQAGSSTISQRVISRIFHRRVDTVLTTAIDTVKSQRVIDGLVVLINHQFNRVHGGRVALQLCSSLLS